MTIGRAKETVILGMARTPVGKFMGCLAGVRAPKLGAIAIKEAVKRSGINPAGVEGVIMGNVCPAGIGQAPARQAAVISGLSPEIPALTVNKVCGSGMIAVSLACQMIKAGDANLIVAGGQESMSNVPYYLKRLRTGQKMGDAKLQDGMIYDGIWDFFGDVHMGALADFTAKNSNISREEQDKWALRSHQRAVAAIREGKFKEQIVSVPVPQRRGEPRLVDTDEGPRSDTTLEKLAKLKPAFTKDGTVTAGNASSINDGAAALVVASETYAQKKGLAPMARIVAYSTGSVEPKMLFYAPIKAVRTLLKIQGVNVDYFDLIELNEAFASQFLADSKELGWNLDKVNIYGSGISMGHPVGCTGARILITLIYALRERGLKKGLAAICLGGGEASVMSIELP
ncbi:acetyl-CoA acetyltransferase [candidate division WOR-3 bacterium JGI_Cruoil_03_51_56]|uniref:Acetyl-CoA acetyltransferase n=1 Tax=candidate division WOR-3 bacterium JGI_Cruoil_03_51_56 TaxID=1973747 RepID=A0A235BRR2_UNCW3|nr:MAG: acetyl-CoA acetyltransferase [candidate division WOR-3 bacterium JGI_Cruoil_03_51_56]